MFELFRWCTTPTSAALKPGIVSDAENSSLAPNLLALFSPGFQGFHHSAMASTPTQTQSQYACYMQATLLG